MSALILAALLATNSTLLIAAEPSATSKAGGKKLLIFILAGQSNMQGHAEVSTLAYLPKPAYVPTKEEWALLTPGLARDVRLKSEAVLSAELLKDPANAKLTKKDFAAVLQNSLNSEIEKVRNERYEDFKNAKPIRLAQLATRNSRRFLPPDSRMQKSWKRLPRRRISRAHWK